LSAGGGDDVVGEQAAEFFGGRHPAEFAEPLGLGLADPLDQPAGLPGVAEAGSVRDPVEVRRQ